MIENFSKEECLEIYRKLLLARRFEEKTIELGNQGEILGSIHAGIGMEATQVGIAISLKEGDIALKTHRDHGQLIAEGVDPKYMFAELMGKINGYNKGFGGSMHLPGISGVLGVNAHMAAGAALGGFAASYSFTLSFVCNAVLSCSFFLLVYFGFKKMDGDRAVASVTGPLKKDAGAGWL